MASEREANLAREQNSEFLRGLGAHAITVDQVKGKRDKTFAVVAYFQKKPDGVPTTLEVKSGKRIVQVPLVARVAPKFKLE